MADARHPQKTLRDEPRGFFMTLRDIAFWIRSARADSALARHLRDNDAPAAFDRLYASTNDPYGSALPQFRYQRRKYEALVSMLPARRYQRILDVGCGLGVLTRMLADYADHVTGIDVSAEAVAQARKLSAAYPNVEFVQGDVNASTADGYDLVVVADVVYYLTSLDERKLRELASRVAAMIAPGGLLLLVDHYFFGIDPASRTTRRIHDVFRSSPGLVGISERRRAFYLATLFGRV